MLERTLYSVDVKESDRGREYWAARPWIGAALEGVRTAPILVVPWEDMRENLPVAFPQGTDAFVKRLRARGEFDFAIAATPEVYAEISLHSKVWRFPTLLVTHLLLPALAGALGDEIHDVIQKGSSNDTVELRVIVEGDHGKAISIEYKGPPSRAVDTLTTEAGRHLPAITRKASELPPETPIVCDAPKTKRSSGAAGAPVEEQYGEQDRPR